MKELLLTDDNLMVHPAPEIIEMQPFRKIIRRDRGSPRDSDGKKKLQAIRELCYIYHMVDPRSNYSQFLDDDQRSKNIISDFFEKNGVENWEPDDVVKEAMDVYERLRISPLMRLLRSSEQVLLKFSILFDNADFDEDDDGKKAKNIMSIIEKIPKAVATVADLKEKIQAEESEANKIMGGLSRSKYNT